MLHSLSTLEQRMIDTLPDIMTESALFEYKNTILGKTGELTIILK